MRHAPLAVVATTLLALACSEALAAGEPVSRSRTVSISGEADVMVTPDLAEVSIGVTTEGPTAAGAMQSNSQTVAAVLDVFKKEGIQPKDLQTSGFSLQPRFEPVRSSSGQRLNGYIAGNMVSVRVRDLSKLGAVLDKAISSGANDVRSIQFDVAARAELQDEARRKAMDDAFRKAGLYATAGNVKLGPILSIEEDGAAAMARKPMYAAAMKADRAVPVEAGELGIFARVHVVYELQD